MFELNVSNLSHSESPVSTVFCGVPLSQLVNEDGRPTQTFANEVGDTVTVVRREWGRGMGLVAVTSRGLDPFTERVSKFYPVSFHDTPRDDGMTGPFMSVSAKINGDEQTVRLAKLPMPEGATTPRLTTWFGRVGRTQHVAYLWVYETARGVLRVAGMVGTSDYTTPATVSYPESIKLKMDSGITLVCDYAEQRDIRYLVDGVELTRDDRFMHGQAIVFSGSLLIHSRLEDDPDEAAAAHAATSAPVKAQVTPRTLPLELLPFGTLPKLHPSHKGRERELALADYRRVMAKFFETRGSHWAFDGPYTGVLDPRQTGSTETFGMVKLCPALAVPTGFPAHFHAMLPDVYSEAKRPSFFFEPNGLPFMAALHPDYVPDGQGPHFHPGVNGDFLGKPPRYQWTTKPTGGWKTEDFAHSGSSIALGLLSMLDGCALSRFLCFQDVEQYKTIKPGTKTFYQARGMGRSLLDIVYAAIAVNDPTFEEHLREVLQKDPGLAAVRGQIARGEQIIATEVNRKPDPRKFGGKKPFWMPWSSPGLQIPGLVAAQWLLGDNTAGDELDALCTTLALFGIWQEEGGRWRVADAIAYEGPEALDPNLYLDSDYVRAGSYEDWNYPSLATAVDRCDDSEAKRRALAYCNDVEKRFLTGPAPGDPFARPIPFFAFPPPVWRDDVTKPALPVEPVDGA